MSTFTLKHRAAVSKWFGLALLTVLGLARGTWELPHALVFAREAAAFMLVAVAVMGRLWASVYISGHKNRRVVVDGPYSVVRNPLYLFSLLGAVGIGLASHSLVILATIIVAFLLLYAFTISSEEAQLSEIFGEEYDRYRSSTRRLIPRWKNFRQPESQTVSPKDFTRALVDTMWFVWLYGLVKAIDVLHAQGALPVLIALP